METTPASNKKLRRLLIRLSSMGDVILATSALQAASMRDSENDWVVAKEFELLLSGHSSVRTVIPFDRRGTSFSDWKAFCRKLWDADYDEVYDLHSSLRTRIMRIFFVLWSLTDRRRAPRWNSISKQRVRLNFYFLFKGLWPKGLRPASLTSRAARLLKGSGAERPDLRHLLSKPRSSELESLLHSLKGQKYICVMPSSRWQSKKWPAEYFAEVLQKLSTLVVVMGTRSDSDSVRLCEVLKSKGVPVISGVGNWAFYEVAQILSGAQYYFGNDTGLAHLAESVGVPSNVIFGPTKEDMGFGPWRPESRALGKDLVCRPCSKDGRNCYRLMDRYACLKSLTPKDVFQQLTQVAPEIAGGKNRRASDGCGKAGSGLHV